MDSQLKNEVRRLTTRLGAMVKEQAGEAVFAHVEELVDSPNPPDPELGKAKCRWKPFGGS